MCYNNYRNKGKGYSPMMKFYYLIFWYDNRGTQYEVFENRCNMASVHRLLKERAKRYDHWEIRVYTEHAWNNLGNGKALVFLCDTGYRKGSFKISIEKGW